MIRIAINGAAGKMGQRLIALAGMDKDLTVVAGLENPRHPRIGEDLGVIAGVGPLHIPLVSAFDVPADVVIDFSVPEAAEAIIERCEERKVPLVVATTGFSDKQTQQILDASKEIPLLWAPSMSLAVNLTMRLTELAAKALKDQDADVEIIERHHRYKADAPSGTALKFGEIIKNAMGITGERHGREGKPGRRPHNEIGYHAVRVGDNPGEHTIVFGMLGETIELKVSASNRDCYASGALSAAKFLVGKPVGLYGMKDVLGF